MRGPFLVPDGKFAPGRLGCKLAQRHRRLAEACGVRCRPSGRRVASGGVRVAAERRPRRSPRSSSKRVTDGAGMGSERARARASSMTSAYGPQARQHPSRRRCHLVSERPRRSSPTMTTGSAEAVFERGSARPRPANASSPNAGMSTPMLTTSPSTPTITTLWVTISAGDGHDREGLRRRFRHRVRDGHRPLLADGGPDSVASVERLPERDARAVKLCARDPERVNDFETPGS